MNAVVYEPKDALVISTEDISVARLLLQDLKEASQQSEKYKNKNYLELSSFEKIDLNLRFNSTLNTIEPDVLKLPRMELAALELNSSQSNWIAELKPQVKKRLELAQQKFGTLDEDWSIPDPIQKQLIELEPHVFVGNASTDLIGKIRLTQGSALGDQHMRVFHEVQGQTQAEAEIDLVRGTFRFESIEPIGQLKGEIRDQDGVVVASATAAFPEQGAESRQKSDARPVLEFKPVEFLPVVYHEVFGSSVKVKSPVKTETLSGVPRGFDQSTSHPHSLVALRTSGKGYTASVQMAFAQSEVKVPLYPISLVKAWKESLVETPTEDTPLIHGRVIHDGEPLSDVQVEVVDTEGYIVSYLNSWIPDSALTMTSQTGEFILADLEPGLHQLAYKRHGETLGRQFVFVDKNAVTPTLFQSKTKHILSEVITFDAFSGEAHAAVVDFTSSGSDLNTAEQSTVWMKASKNLGQGRVSPIVQGYLSTAFAYDEGSKKIEVPAVSSLWMEDLKKSIQNSLDPQKIHLIGFVNSAAYQVLHSKELGEEILYFSSQGLVVDHPVEGGGFVLFNRDRSNYFVELQLSSGRIYSKLIPQVSSTSYSVLSFL